MQSFRGLPKRTHWSNMQLAAASSVRWLCVLVLLKAALAIPEGPHMNTLNVLLPPKATNPIRYRLQGSGGCFTWSWDHHDVIHLKPEFNGTEGCSSSAVVTSIASYDGRKSTAVYAKDTLTGQVIRCEVLIDKLSRIRISHHSLKLDLDGLATLRIHAFDMEDNMFSSLVGIQFLWKLVPSKLFTGIPAHCLTHVPLKSTPLSDCGCVCGDIDTQIELEDQGLGADLFVVRGVTVGQERVLVNLTEPTLESLGDEIGLTVAEAISIEPPSPLYVLVDTQIQYTLSTLRYKYPSVIKLPSPHHRWLIMDSAVAEIDQSMGSLATKGLGSTNVIVQDIRLTGHQHLSSLHVVVPSSLILYLTPVFSKGASQHTIMGRETRLKSSDTPWCLVVGWDYVVEVMAFSAQSGSSSLFLTKGNSLSLFFDEWPFWRSIAVPEDIQKEQGWHNGTLIKAVSEGVGGLAAVLKFRSSLLDGNVEEALTVEQKVLVCSPVIILSENEEVDKALSLPWNPKISQAYQLKVQGGCGSQFSDYRWFSLDSTIASVNSYGQIHATGLGHGVIRAVALTNYMNVDEVKVQIACPSSLVKVEGLPLETEVGSHLPAAVSLQNPDGHFFSKCESFSSLIDWKIIGGEASFVQTNDTGGGLSERSSLNFQSPNSVCDWKDFLAVRPGRATITASLAVDSSCGILEPSSLRELSVSWTITAYAPLTIMQAGDGDPYGGYHCGTNHLETAGSSNFINQCEISILQLVPGSSMRVMLKGGPEPLGQAVHFIERHEVITSEINRAEHLLVSRLIGSGGRLYDISCGSIGTYTITFYRGNYFGEDHTASQIASVKLSVSCSLPSSITLLIDAENSIQNIKASAQVHRDYNRVHQSALTVVSGRTLRVSVAALNAMGIPFANASSLPVDWMLVDCLNLVYWEGRSMSEAYIDHGRWEENIALKDSAGQCLLRATVRLLGAESWLLSELHVHSSELSKQGSHILTDAVHLQLVTSLRVSPKTLLLYNHINAKGVLTVLGGSSHIEAYSNDSKVALVVEQPLAQASSQKTIAARGLGAALVTIQDVGLISPAMDTALVIVAEVAWLRLIIFKEASIEVGAFLEIFLEGGDSAGNIFSNSQLEFMDIHVHVKNGVLKLVQKEDRKTAAESMASGSSFLVRGANVGVADVYVSLWPKYGHEIVSEVRKVEVYERLTLQPEGLVLAPGARYVVWTQGGPTIGVLINFESSNATIVSVENAVGMIAANFPGFASIYAHAVTHDGTILCTSALAVRVHVPETMHLNVRGGQLALGRKMSLFPVGAQEDLFSFYELCRSYKWTTGDSQVLTVISSDGSIAGQYEHSLTSGASRNAEKSDVDAGFSVVVIGRSVGKTDISVGFSCHFHSKSYSSTQLYTTSAAIQVIPDPPLALGMVATWLLPPNYKTSSLLPQSIETSSESTLSGKRSITYSVLQDSCKDPAIISLEGAHIKTSERKDIACIQARDRRTGRSEIAVCLRVAEVGQMVVGDSESPMRKVDVSVGAYHLYAIMLQDDIGIPFHETGDAVHLLVETNRIDVVSIKILNEEDHDYNGSATVFVQALRQGTALVRISQLGYPGVVDYILVDVGAFIIPKNPTLHVGGSVNFSVTGKSLSSSDHGYWLSSNPNVLQVNRHTGEALALGAGSASVSFNSSHLTAYTTTTVVQISSIVVQGPKGPLTNVQIPEKGYLFPIKFSDLGGHDLGFTSLNQRVAYNCRIDPPYLGRCVPWRSPEDEKSYCVFHPYSPERLFLVLQGLGEGTGSSFMVGDSKGYMTIKIIAEVVGLSEVGSVLSSFAGGFKLQEKTSKVLLNPKNNKTRLTVVGSAGAVGVSWTRTDVLEVKRVSTDKTAHGFGGHAVFEVLVVNGEEPFLTSLMFHLPTTGQVEEIPVEYDIKDPHGGAFLRQIITALIVIAVLGLLPFLACARLFDLPRRRYQEQNTSHTSGAGLRERGAATDSPVSPIRPLHSSNFDSPQSVSLSRSPPQPYSEYVSKTIEHTPYFRREGVRRFDPSRTY